jgi:outer membrane usher protein
VLPANATIDSIEQFVTPRRNGGIQVKFPIRFAQSALATAVTIDGQPLAAGTLLVDRENQQDYLVGWDGEIYIENLVSPISLYWDEGNCSLQLQPALDATIALPRLGRFICEPVAGESNAR